MDGNGKGRTEVIVAFYKTREGASEDLARSLASRRGERKNNCRWRILSSEPRRSRLLVKPGWEE